MQPSKVCLLFICAYSTSALKINAAYDMNEDVTSERSLFTGRGVGYCLYKPAPTGCIIKDDCTAANGCTWPTGDKERSWFGVDTKYKDAGECLKKCDADSGGPYKYFTVNKDKDNCRCSDYCFKPPSGSSETAYKKGECSAGAGGDPHVTTMTGNKFNILQVGTFPLLEVTRNANALLAIHFTIGRVESGCSATYINDVTVAGEWLGQQHPNMKMRVVHYVPKEEALQVRINDAWHPSARVNDFLNSTSVVTKATPSQVVLSVHDVKIRISVGANTRKNDANLGYNFLNVHTFGLDSLDDQQVRVGGILGHDDYSNLAKAPDDCPKHQNLGRLVDSAEMEDNEDMAYFMSEISEDPF